MVFESHVTAMSSTSMLLESHVTAINSTSI